MFSSKSLLDDDDVVLIDVPTLPSSTAEAAILVVDLPVVETVDAVSQPMTHIDGGSLQKTVNTTATESIPQQQQQVEEDEDAHIEQELLQIDQAQELRVVEGNANNTRVPQLYKGIQTPLRGKSLLSCPPLSYYILIDLHTLSLHSS